MASLSPAANSPIKAGAVGPDVVGKTLLSSPKPKGEMEKAQTSVIEGDTEDIPLSDDEDNRNDDVSPPVPLTVKERRWAMLIVVLSCWDLLTSGCIAVVSLGFGYKNEGVSLYCLAIQGVSHMMCSFVLAMRFMGELLPPREDQNGASDAEILKEQRRRDLRREQAFSLIVASAMLVSCCAMLFKAFRKMKFWDSWYLDHDDMDHEIENVTSVLAWWGFGGYVIQAITRFLGARIMKRSILWHSFSVSVVSLIYFFVFGLAASYDKEWTWKADPIAAIMLVFVMLCESIRMVISHLHDVDTHMRHNTLL
mmetsp:Transcript_71592/g.186221  ORF Transcript_71592/g.186221 Transcript_71592/m.186221 type:complete len:309 (-) Transcript_71592:263-1189(-)